jgi:hypothetical protein
MPVARTLKPDSDCETFAAWAVSVEEDSDCEISFCETCGKADASSDDVEEEDWHCFGCTRPCECATKGHERQQACDPEHTDPVKVSSATTVDVDVLQPRTASLQKAEAVDALCGLSAKRPRSAVDDAFEPPRISKRPATNARLLTLASCASTERKVTGRTTDSAETLVRGEDENLPP